VRYSATEQTEQEGRVRAAVADPANRFVTASELAGRLNVPVELVRKVRREGIAPRMKKTQDGRLMNVAGLTGSRRPTKRVIFHLPRELAEGMEEHDFDWPAYLARGIRKKLEALAHGDGAGPEPT
jgi:hypothetical protein